MGKVRARPETGNLYLDFNYQGVRCREQTALPDTPSNRKKVEALLKRVEASIVLDQFDYAEMFPGSKNAQKFMSADDAIATTAKTPKVQKARRQSSLPTVAQFVEQWFQEHKIEWRNSHTRNVRSLLDSSIIPFFGKKALDQVSKADLLAYRTLEGAKKGRDGNESLNPKTLNNRMSIIRKIFEEASDRYGFDTPYRNIKPLRLRRTHIEPFSLGEVHRILDNVREDFKNYYAVRFFSGMRTGEIDGLKWKFVDFKNRVILIRETLSYGQTEYTKTDGSQREIPMFGPVYEALKNQNQATGKLSEYVFCNSKGEPLDHNNVTKRVWYPLLRYLGLEKRRPYQTRHTAATLLLASGENPEWVARVLGHTSTEMLFKVYSRYIPNLTRMDGSAFENLVTTSQTTPKEVSNG